MALLHLGIRKRLLDKVIWELIISWLLVGVEHIGIHLVLFGNWQLGGYIT